MAKGDMFLRVEGAKQGPIKGESEDREHKEAIDVLQWTWGMAGNVVHGQRLGKTTAKDLRITKGVDRASTALMSSLRNNELLKKAELIVRKAGGAKAIDYFKIELQNARITSIELGSGEGVEAAELREHVSIAFDKISVQYSVQASDGSAGAASEFTADFAGTA